MAYNSWRAQSFDTIIPIYPIEPAIRDEYVEKLIEENSIRYSLDMRDKKRYVSFEPRMAMSENYELLVLRKRTANKNYKPHSEVTSRENVVDLLSEIKPLIFSALAFLVVGLFFLIRSVRETGFHDVSSLLLLGSILTILMVSIVPFFSLAKHLK